LLQPNKKRVPLLTSPSLGRIFINEDRQQRRPGKKVSEFPEPYHSLPMEAWPKAQATYRAISKAARRARKQGREKAAQRLERRLPSTYAMQAPQLASRLIS
jgi:hypothetical protein